MKIILVIHFTLCSMSNSHQDKEWYAISFIGKLQNLIIFVFLSFSIGY